MESERPAAKPELAAAEAQRGYGFLTDSDATVFECIDPKEMCDRVFLVEPPDWKSRRTGREATSDAKTLSYGK